MLKCFNSDHRVTTLSILYLFMFSIHHTKFEVAWTILKDLSYQLQTYIVNQVVKSFDLKKKKMD